MMPRCIISLSTLALLAIASCQHGPYRAETRTLSEYLDRKFQIDLPRERSYFLVLNGVACSACSSELAATFASLRAGKPNLFAVTNDPDHISRFGAEQPGRRQVLFDDTPELSRLDIGTGGATLFIVEDGEVVDKTELGPENAHMFATIVK